MKEQGSVFAASNGELDLERRQGPCILKIPYPGTWGDSWVNLHMYHVSIFPLYSTTKSKWEPPLCPSNLQSWLWSRGTQAPSFSSWYYRPPLSNNIQRSLPKDKCVPCESEEQLWEMETKDTDGHTSKYQRNTSYWDSSSVSVFQISNWTE